MGNVVGLFKGKNSKAKNDIMIVCEKYYRGKFDDIPSAEEYEDKELVKILGEGGVLAIRYEEYELVPLVVSSMLKMKILKDVLYFEIATGVGQCGAFNKLIPVFKIGKETSIRHNSIRFVSDKMIAVCLKQAYASSELVVASSD